MNRHKTWIRIAHCRDIPLRDGRAVRIGNREIAIFNLGDRFLAIQNHYPHRNGPLADGIVSGATIVCPLHAWKFNLETDAGENAPSRASCVQTFATCIEDGVVLLEFPVVPAEEEFSSGCLEVKSELNSSQSAELIEGV